MTAIKLTLKERGKIGFIRYMLQTKPPHVRPIILSEREWFHVASLYDVQVPRTKRKHGIPLLDAVRPAECYIDEPTYESKLALLQPYYKSGIDIHQARCIKYLLDARTPPPYMPVRVFNARMLASLCNITIHTMQRIKVDASLLPIPCGVLDLLYDMHILGSTTKPNAYRERYMRHCIYEITEATRKARLTARTR